MEDKLKQYLERQWPDADEIEIEEFAIIAGGYSRETYRFNARVRRQGMHDYYPMILRKDPPEVVAILNTSREMEHNLLHRVKEHTTIPVSHSHFVENDPTTFGERAMLLERVHGSGEPSLLFHGGPNQDQAESVATHLCELIAELHLADVSKLNPAGELNDPRGAGIDVSSWTNYMESTFKYYIGSYERMAFAPIPVFYDGYLTLRRDRPRELPLVLCHGDFNPSNFLYEDGKVTALIDWENSHVGDPREDLGWLALMDALTNTNILGSVKEDGGFLQHYNKLTGFGVTPEEVAYFSMFSGANIGIPVISAVRRRLNKEHDGLLNLYMLVPVIQSQMVFFQCLGYPMPTAGDA
ncbi:MAG: phosphotransferase family protein [Anaerolineaceae bacterium]